MASVDISTPDGRLEALRLMLLIREFEDRVKDRFADNEIPGFVHLSQGQEAVAVGACSAIEDRDYITGTHRGHGQCLAKGLEPDALLAELYGKAAGSCSGKGGSMHAADLQEGMLGVQPIIGASVSLGVGAAISAQVRDADWMVVSFLGDGATATGQVHEGVNLAATWDLPAVFVIENNQYSEGMVFDEQHNVEDLADMAASYGIPGEVVDGQNVLEVYEAVESARGRAMAGDGPTLIEAKTYRFRGHFEGDPQPYRTEEEVRQWRENRDPIDTLRQRLVDTGELSQADFERMQTDVGTTMDEAVEFARNAEKPDPETAYEEVFSEPVPEIDQFRRRMETDGDLPPGGRR